MYNVKAWLVRKTEEIRKSSVVEEMLKEVAKKAIRVPKLRYKKHKEGCVYELDVPDLHFGKLTWGEETGMDYDIKIARQMALTAIDRLLQYMQYHEVNQILLPWGNDFYNVDTEAETTAKGTPQQEDTRWKKTFREGRILTQQIIDLCSQYAQTDVVFIPGNHDKQRLYFLGECMVAAFSKNPNVTIDNGPRTRKYRHYQNVLLGFCHGSDERPEKLPTIMSMEQKEAWSQSVYREWHLGDKHHSKQLELKHEEQLACTVRYLSSLTATDAWHFDNLFVGSNLAATSFVWHPLYGLQAEYHARGD
jgi:hypothetical protein